MTWLVGLGAAAVDHPVASGDAAVALKMYSSIRFVATEGNVRNDNPSPGALG